MSGGRWGLLRAIRVRLRPTDLASTWHEIRSATAIASSFTWTLPNANPGTTQLLQVDSSGNVGYTSGGGGGSVTSVGLTAPADLLTISGSPVTTSGTIAAAKVSQSANLFYASPSGSSGVPVFRGIALADISPLIGTAAGTIAAGNDSRFHTQNTDTGTTQVSFQLNSGASGVRLRDASGVLQARNAADSAFADFTANNVIVAGNLTVQGTTFTVNSETLTIDDNIIVLNNNVSTGTPTEDGGVQIRRGASVSASLNWDETGDFWEAGLLGSELRIARYTEATFTNAALVAGIYTFTHNLGNARALIQVFDDTGREIQPDDITRTNANTATIDLTTYGTLSNTWAVAAAG